MKQARPIGVALVGLALVGAACISAAPAEAQPAAAYIATLHPMNTAVTGSTAGGQVHITVKGDTMTIVMDVTGVPPDIIHWQHFHGFTDNRVATCPTAAADANHDGIVDLMETAPMSGMTMVPLDSDPAAMDIAHGTYPRASAAGTYHYQVTVSVKALGAAFAKAFPGQALDLDHRVIFVHGVPATTHLPATAASLGTIPARVTLPIACGKIERVAP